MSVHSIVRLLTCGVVAMTTACGGAPTANAPPSAPDQVGYLDDRSSPGQLIRSYHDARKPTNA